jgi:hypothetical protein
LAIWHEREIARWRRTIRASYVAYLVTTVIGS